MGLKVGEKIAAFCRELEDPVLEGIVRGNGAGELFERVKASVVAGQDDAGVEADLDQLNRIVRESTGFGFYPSGFRRYQPLSGASPDSGAMWWSCPAKLCAGRGRVRPDEKPPICAATETALVARPLAR